MFRAHLADTKHDVAAVYSPPKRPIAHLVGQPAPHRRPLLGEQGAEIDVGAVVDGGRVMEADISPA